MCVGGGGGGQHLRGIRISFLCSGGCFVCFFSIQVGQELLQRFRKGVPIFFGRGQNKKLAFVCTPGPIPSIIPPHWHYNPSRPSWLLRGTLEIIVVADPGVRLLHHTTHLAESPHPHLKKMYTWCGAMTPSHIRAKKIRPGKITIFFCLYQSKNGDYYYPPEWSRVA